MLENESNARATRRKRRAEAMATRRTNPVYRAQENERNAEAMATRCHKTGEISTINNTLYLPTPLDTIPLDTIPLPYLP